MKPLAHNRGVLVEEPEYFGPRSLSDGAVRAFPELATALAGDAESLHVQVGTLAAAGRSAITRGDRRFLERLFAFVEDVLSRPRLHPEIPNALVTSFLTPMDFDASESGREAWQSVSPKLRQLLDQAI